MADCLSAGTGSIPVGSANFLRERFCWWCEQRGRGPSAALRISAGGSDAARAPQVQFPLAPPYRGDDPIGRALVSKTSSSRFESCHPCQVFVGRVWYSGRALGFQPDDASSTLAARSIYGNAEFVQEQYPGSPVRKHGCESRTPLQSLRWRSQDSKASACRADHRECNSPRHLQSLKVFVRAAVADIQRRLPCKQVDAGGNPASSSIY